MRKKVTIVGGGGAVGATAAQRIIDRGLADVVLADVLEGIPAGRALDMLESTPIIRSDVNAIGFTSKDSDYRETAQQRHHRRHRRVSAKTGHEPERPASGQLRDRQGRGRPGAQAFAGCDSHRRNESARRHGVRGVQAERLSEAARHRHGGRARFGRMSTFVAQELGVSVANVHSLVLGGHGDTMVPLPRYTTVASIPLPELLPKERIEAINQRTRDGGAEIVNLMKTGGAYYAPSAAVVEMVEAILKDQKKILPCAVYLQGEYGLTTSSSGCRSSLAHEASSRSSSSN